MSFWSSLLKYGGQAVKATGRSAGQALLQPSRTLRGAGQAVKTGAIGGAVGYVGWEKLTTDKSVVRIVSDAVVGSDASDAIAETATDVKALKEKAGEAIETMNTAMGDMNSKWSGMTNFFQGLFSGNGIDMFKNFFSNLSKGNVSGLSLAGLVAAAYLVFGRGGFLGKLAGTLLALMLIGNNANMNQVLTRDNGTQRSVEPEETQSRGMKR
ncbi:MAG: hypothetical protein J6C92_04630 [Bacteroidaceae bacterium]|nr:hypothetical protein [Bacteroidaceae bacterium]